MRPNRLATFATIVLLIAVAILFPSGEKRAPATAFEAPPPQADSLALLAKHYPAAPQHAREGVTIVRTPDGFEPRFGGNVEPQINTPGSRWKNPAKAVLPKFPKHFNNPMSVSSTFDRNRTAGVPPASSGPGQTVAPSQITYSASAVPLNASAQSTGELASGGTLLYKDAFGEGIDVIYRVQALKTEEFIVIEPADQSPARQQGVGAAKMRQFSWHLSLGEGESKLKPRLTPMHTIELCDEKGVPRLRIDLPEGKDADGTRLTAGKELRYTIEGDRLTLAADLSAAKFPVVIDPSWSSTGAMAATREYHTATKLQNGTVLVVGGSGSPSTCEVYDPITGLWQATNPLKVGRERHSATLLGNGMVLVAGGANSVSWPFVAELYNPLSGTWSDTGALAQTRILHTATRLLDGNVLVSGGFSGGGSIAACEIYDTTPGQWRTTGPLGSPRQEHSATLLANGDVLVAGSINSPRECEIFNHSTEMWAATGLMSTGRKLPNSAILPSGNVLVFGGLATAGSAASCEEFNPSQGSWTTLQSMINSRELSAAVLLSDARILVTGGAATGGTYLKQCELYDRSANSWSATAEMATSRIRHTATLIANDFVLVVGGLDENFTTLSTCEIFDKRSAPTATISKTQDNFDNVVQFSSVAVDADGDVISYSWNFGDGNTSIEQNPAHIFANSGSYLVTLTVTDTTQKFTTTSINIIVSKPPAVRITTDDVVGFATLPLVFDATLSTDPENQIASYTWDFGDGTPLGAGQVISKIYDQPGTYTVTLTVTDAAGVSSTLQRIIEVLPADQAGLFNGFVTYKARWDRDKESKDTLQLTAQVNVGDQVVGAGTVVALDIVGQHFEGTLDLKLRDKTDPNDVWQVKANLRKQPFGTVLLKVKIKNADLGLGFNQAGAVLGGDPHDIVDASIPVRITIGSRSFELNVASEFKFNANGKRAKGEGDE